MKNTENNLPKHRPGLLIFLMLNSQKFTILRKRQWTKTLSYLEKMVNNDQCDQKKSPNVYKKLLKNDFTSKL